VRLLRKPHSYVASSEKVIAMLRRLISAILLLAILVTVPCFGERQTDRVVETGFGNTLWSRKPVELYKKIGMPHIVEEVEGWMDSL
jgi:hypothetical protein